MSSDVEEVGWLWVMRGEMGGGGCFEVVVLGGDKRIK